MHEAVPHYYTNLAPFRALFRRGLPILTYHNLGPRPPRVRLKGLYLSQTLFHQQLEELSAAGFHSASLDPWNHNATPGQNRIVLTFDDGFRNVWDHGRTLLAAHAFTAIQFLVVNLIGRSSEWQRAEGEVVEPLMDDSQIRAWLAAGHQIGSHTLTHPRLTTLPPAEAQREIHDSKRRLEDRFGVPIRHFCYPYGDLNERIGALVAEAGYTTACTTEPGINTPATDPFRLRRITARYRSRRLKDLLPRWLTRRPAP